MKIVNKKYYKGEGYYIGRPSILGNPFPVKKSKFVDKIYSTEESLTLYKQWLWEQIKSQNQLVLTELNKLAKMDNITLVCWCVNEQGEGRCHGFIIRDCIEWIKRRNASAKKFNDYLESDEFAKLKLQSDLNMKKWEKYIYE